MCASVNKRLCCVLLGKLRDRITVSRAFYSGRQVRVVGVTQTLVRGSVPSYSECMASDIHYLASLSLISAL